MLLTYVNIAYYFSNDKLRLQLEIAKNVTRPGVSSLYIAHSIYGNLGGYALSISFFDWSVSMYKLLPDYTTSLVSTSVANQLFAGFMNYPIAVNDSLIQWQTFHTIYIAERAFTNLSGYIQSTSLYFSKTLKPNNIVQDYGSQQLYTVLQMRNAKLLVFVFSKPLVRGLGLTVMLTQSNSPAFQTSFQVFFNLKQMYYLKRIQQFFNQSRYGSNVAEHKIVVAEKGYSDGKKDIRIRLNFTFIDNDCNYFDATLGCLSCRNFYYKYNKSCVAKCPLGSRPFSSNGDRSKLKVVGKFCANCSLQEEGKCVSTCSRNHVYDPYGLTCQFKLDAGSIAGIVISVLVVAGLKTFLILKCISKIMKPDKIQPDNPGTCSICLDDDTIFMKILNCEHKFHQECIQKWRERNAHCPNCRAAIVV